MSEEDEEFNDFLSFLANESLVHLRNMLEHIKEMGLAGDETTEAAEAFLNDFQDFIIEDEELI